MVSAGEIGNTSKQCRRLCLLVSVASSALEADILALFECGLRDRHSQFFRGSENLYQPTIRVRRR